MEIEIKLRLPDSTAHQLLSDALSPHHLRTHEQQNLFFDGADGALSARLAALRFRFYDGDARCVVSLKSRPSLSGGVSVVEEDEEEVDPVAARAVVAEPRRMGGFCRIVRRVVEEYGDVEFVCLGGFRNVRAVYGWKEGLVVELDETQYEFGTSYEVECETNEPDRAKELLEGFLKEKGIPYSYSQASKFAVFRAGISLQSLIDIGRKSEVHAHKAGLVKGEGRLTKLQKKTLQKSWWHLYLRLS